MRETFSRNKLPAEKFTSFDSHQLRRHTPTHSYVRAFIGFLIFFQGFRKTTTFGWVFHGNGARYGTTTKITVQKCRFFLSPFRSYRAAQKRRPKRLADPAVTKLCAFDVAQKDTGTRTAAHVDNKTVRYILFVRPGYWRRGAEKQGEAHGYSRYADDLCSPQYPRTAETIFSFVAEGLCSTRRRPVSKNRKKNTATRRPCAYVAIRKVAPRPLGKITKRLSLDPCPFERFPLCSFIRIATRRRARHGYVWRIFLNTQKTKILTNLI